MPRHLFPRPLVVLLAVSAVLLVGACSTSDPQSTFDAAGPVAEKQRDLFYIILGMAVLVFVPVVGVLVYVLFRFRRRLGEDRMPAQTHGNTPLEIAWTIAPAIVLAVIAVPTIIYLFDIAKTPEDAMEINVTGHQWWWEFEYPEQNVITANELHVPIDKPVSLKMTSDDVIHSFWIPKLAGKVDVIPNNINKLNFTANFAGNFLGQCAEFCGEAHAHMRFRVIVESQFEFDQWVAGYKELAQRPPPTTGKAGEGYTVFASRGCLLCHTTSGPASAELRRSLKEAFERGELRFPAPNLTNFGTRTTLAAGILDNDPEGEGLRKWLTDPEDVKPGNRMVDLANVYVDPSAALSDEDISALTAYLLSLK